MLCSSKLFGDSRLGGHVPVWMDPWVPTRTVDRWQRKSDGREKKQRGETADVCVVVEINTRGGEEGGLCRGSSVVPWRGRAPIERESSGLGHGQIQAGLDLPPAVPLFRSQFALEACVKD